MKSVLIAAATLSVILFASAKPAFAVTPITPKVTIENGYIFTPLAGSNATAGYGTLTNISSAPIEILGLKSASFKAAEMHETKEENGLMKMKRLSKLTLKPGEKFELTPGGNHMMLFDATKPLKAGDSITLVFEIADSAGKPTIASPITVKAKDRGSKATDGSTTGSGHDHSHH